MLYKFHIDNNDRFRIKNNGNKKTFINQLKIVALIKTTALLQDVWSAYP